MNCKNGEIVKGRVIAITQENDQIALSVQLKDDITAIMPAEEMGLEKIEGTNLRVIARKLVGRTIIGKVVKNNPLTISNKQAIAEMIQSTPVAVGQIFEGKVISINETEASIEVNSCLITTLPQSELGIMRTTNLKMILKHGQNLRVEVKEIKDGKIIVSHKKFLEDKELWQSRLNKYQIRGQYLGIATNFIKNGVFVNLEPGIDLLCSPQPDWFTLQRGDEIIVEIIDKSDNGKIKGMVTGNAIS